MPMTSPAEKLLGIKNKSVVEFVFVKQKYQSSSLKYIFINYRH